MKRYKSIDGMRGLFMIIMIGGHLFEWWLTNADYWLYVALASVCIPVGASGFLFVSGISTSLSFQKSLLRPEASDELFKHKMRNVYIFRALFLLVIAFVYNIAIALALNDLTWIWAWFVLQTIGFSILMAWPFLKTSKILRIIIGIGALALHEILFALLFEFQGQANFYGIAYHILFHPIQLYPILPYFSVFIFGTVIGDIIFGINQIDNEIDRKSAFKRSFFYPVLILGSIIAIFGILYQFPSFLLWTPISARLFGIGVIFVMVSIFIGIEEFNVFKMKKNHRLFYFYSYYSFTIFLAHNPLHFLFTRQLTAVTIWFAVLPIVILMTILLKVLHDKLGPKASLKAIIGLISFKLATKIEVRKKKKILNAKIE